MTNAITPRTEDGKRLRFALLNGLNMSNLGRRDKNIYGSIASLQTLEDLVTETGDTVGVDVTAFHSNHEGDLVDFLEANSDMDGYIINPGGLWAYGDPTRIALEETGKPFIEVHFANIFATGHVSTFTQSCDVTVMGLRHHGYIGALVALAASVRTPATN
ncbi:dehydroquinase [Paenarthrobacter ureafaciens]|uniref:type II 3-dehydroquinate dehydratase n=1 Tax=Paenarthrobacter ureafaciens TaxID=37931 RepID=UPI0015B9BD53|nr:type II 3-dehydroquinate dehydratase [Paenarthrobacter ureafaciens]NWL27169.1 dehydroquinase [Paenarthrobacter ureafaciens]